MANLPTQNLNPGDLKDPTTGNFRKFASPVEGFEALKNDLQGKITGNTHTGLNGNSSLTDFANVWAPASDNNDPKSYATKLATKLGVTPETPISTLSNRLDDFASAIADNEGYQGNRVASYSQTNQAQPVSTNTPSPASPVGGQLTHDQLVQNINAMEQQGASQQEVQGYLDGLKGGNTTQNQNNGTGFVNSATVIPDTSTNTQPQNKEDLLQKAGDVSKKLLDFTGGNKVANLFGTLGAKGYAEIKDALTGSHTAQYIDASAPAIDPLGTALDTGKLGLSLLASTGLIKGAGGLLGSLAGKTATSAAAPIVEDLTGVDASKFVTLGPVEKMNALQEALDGTKLASDRTLLQSAMSEVAPQVLTESGVGSFSDLHPTLAKGLGLTGSAIKSLVKIAGLGVAFGAGQSLLGGLLPK